MSELAEYAIERIFDASREIVWRAWTDPDLLQRWYGPGVETVIHEFDLKPGGMWRNEMKWGDNCMFSKVAFLEVTAPSLLLWHHYSSTDADWNSIENPMMENWPTVLLTAVTFQEVGSKTNVRLSQVPHEASDTEVACFAEMMANMDKGWGAGFSIMDDLLAELQGDT
jgi:uncharacterized protein YndB with AHSA1/START domain